MLRNIERRLGVGGDFSWEILDVGGDLLVDTIESLSGLDLVGRVDSWGGIGLLDRDTSTERTGGSRVEASNSANISGRGCIIG